MDFNPEDLAPDTPEGFLARCAGHFLNDLERDSVEGWEIAAVLFAVVQRTPDGEDLIRWRAYPDNDDAAQLGLFVAQAAVTDAEENLPLEERTRNNVREIANHRRGALLRMRTGVQRGSS